MTLLLLLRWVRHSPWIVAVLLTAAAGSLAWRLALALVPGTQMTRIFAGTDTHADGLLIGAALAVWLHRQVGSAAHGPLRRAGVACSTLGLPVLLLAAPLVPGYAWGVTALAALASSGVILGIVAEGARVTRWLEFSWLVRIGRISYGVYLWHWPVFGWLSVLPVPGASAAPAWRTVLAWGLTFAAASLSYALIERPCLAYKARWSTTLPPVTRAPLTDPELLAALSPDRRPA